MSSTASAFILVFGFCTFPGFGGPGQAFARVCVLSRLASGAAAGWPVNFRLPHQSKGFVFICMCFVCVPCVGVWLWSVYVACAYSAFAFGRV